MTAVVATSLRQNPIYVQIYLTYMNLLFNSFIPLVSLVILNTLVYLQLRKFSHCIDSSVRSSSIQARDVTLARVSCLIVAGKKSHVISTTNWVTLFIIVFIICHSVRWIPNIYELQQGAQSKEELVWPPWVQCTTQFSHLLTVFNSTVNFYIYFLKHRSSNMFRRFLPSSCIRHNRDEDIFPSQVRNLYKR